MNGAVLIGRHCQIGDGSQITDSCIDNYSIIGRNVTIDNSAIMDRAWIGDNAKIHQSIIGRHVIIESELSKQTLIEGVTAIADDVIVSSGSKLISSNIYPHKHIPEGDYEKVTIKT
ncbi:hypothetical protein MUP77_05750 [Candidatus Bathyarchaeota archaeon]|nr:hypothetical protein [Candidatus Bathyarchaeota archaeon]